MLQKIYITINILQNIIFLTTFYTKYNQSLLLYIPRAVEHHTLTHHQPIHPLLTTATTSHSFSLFFMNSDRVSMAMNDERVIEYLRTQHAIKVCSVCVFRHSFVLYLCVFILLSHFCCICWKNCCYLGDFPEYLILLSHFSFLYSCGLEMCWVCHW